MTSRHIVVTGANRGLGLEFARQWLARGDRVFALAREPEGGALAELRERHPDRCRLAACDVAAEDSVADATRRIAREWSAVDLLVNNAGTTGQRGQSVAALDFDDAQHVFNVNALGPLRVARALMDLLRRSPEPVVVNVTSRMGSIDDNHSGGAYAYRMSKAALNMAAVNLAHETRPKGPLVALIHPGWVRTDMGGGGAPLAVDAAVAAMIETIDGFGPDAHGTFVDLHGDPIPW